MWALAGLVACDAPPGPEPAPSEIRILDRHPSSTMPRDGTILLELDAAIDPYSLLRSDVAIRSGDRELGAGLTYDPVWRALTIDPAPARLDPGIDYLFRLDGPTSFDGLRLGPATFWMRVVDELAPAAPPPTPFAEVERVLAPCIPCHGPELRVAGLDVTNLEETAIGVSAEGVRAPTFGRALVGLPLVEPNHPERSYLVYKMLGEGPIVGDVMGTAERPGVPLDRVDISIVSRWIAEGAHVDAP